MQIRIILVSTLLWLTACHSPDAPFKPAGSETAPGSAYAHCRGFTLPKSLAIAHRGASHDAPESTAPAYILARELGADYLELDLQRTRDGELVVLHDDTLQRTTNVGDVFPDRAAATVDQFMLAELEQLDAGSWFNAAFPERARPAFVGSKILTLDEVLDIADSAEGRKPGVYIETKIPELFPGIERDLRDKLASRGWIGSDASGRPRVILQTFSRDSLRELHALFPDTPKVLLLDIGEMQAESEAWLERASQLSPKVLSAWLDYGVENGAVAVGPDYQTLLEPWMIELYRARGLCLHPYTVDEEEAMRHMMRLGAEGMFTNRSDLLLRLYNRDRERSVDEMLTLAGY